jgi:pectate lyase
VSIEEPSRINTRDFNADSHPLQRNCGTRGPSGRFGHQHIYNNLYVDYRYQAIQSRSDNQMLVEANAFFGKTRTAATTYGLVIPEDSPNTGPEGDYEIDGYMNLGKSESARELYLLPI